MSVWGRCADNIFNVPGSRTPTCAGRLGLRNRQSTEANNTYFFPGAGRVLSTCCSAMCCQWKDENAAHAITILFRKNTKPIKDRPHREREACSKTPTPASMSWDDDEWEAPA